MFQWLKKWLAPAESTDFTQEEIRWLSSQVAPPQQPDTVIDVQPSPNRPIVCTPQSLPVINRRPKTLEPELSNVFLKRPLIFDPALKHFDAYRAGEPRFTSEEAAARWFAVREEVLLHALKIIAQSPCAANLILRGSLLLAIWNRQVARRPGDLDWVVSPHTWTMRNTYSMILLRDIEQSLRGSMGGWETPFIIPDAPFVTEDIWCYEKSPGKRLVIPWTCEDPAQNGTIQMDFVFGEQLPSEPTTITFESEPGNWVELQAATPAQSLAWKLLWLETDMHCQGKDLYDAIVLAEATTLNKETFAKTFEIADPKENWLGFTANSIRKWHVEWEHFQNEYPQIEGTADDWKNRLITALEPLFEQLASWRSLKTSRGDVGSN
jgi:hypothetical protein